MQETVYKLVFIKIYLDSLLSVSLLHTFYKYFFTKHL